jgi:large subunit ribosomal protein L15
VRRGFEGGQLPLVKRLPRRRGFTNIFKKQYNIVNVANLAVFPEGSEISPEDLEKAGIIDSTAHPTKILGDGEIRYGVTVRANSFSAAAERKIVAAGGKAERI